MRLIPFEAGRVVCSKQGRDRGRLFVVLNVVDQDFVMMADGSSRKLAHPKRKKVKHLHAKPVLLTEIAHILQSGKPLLDSDLRKALEQSDMEKVLSTCKEGQVLV